MIENLMPSGYIAVLLCFARYSVESCLVSVWANSCFNEMLLISECQIFCTSLHFLQIFYFSFSILMIAWYIDQNQVLSLNNLWIRQSTMRQSDMRNPKQKHDRVYMLNIWIADIYQFWQKCRQLSGVWL